MRKSRSRVEPAFAGASYDAREVPSFDRKDSVAILCAILAVAAIMANALFLQRGPHPSPLMASKVAAPAVASKPADTKTIAEPKDNVVLPRPRPVEMETVKVEAPAAVKSDSLSPPRPIRSIPMPEANVPRPPDPIGDIIAPPTRRVSAVQRVLSDYGYGQIKPTGTLDSDTQDAIEQFERARKIPVTRQITPVLMRELAALTGRPLE